MKKLFFSLIVAAVCLIPSAEAAMSVSISGAGPFAFGTTPTVADGWSTGVIGVNNATYGTVAGLDAQAQVIDPTTAGALGANGNVPPAVLAGFQQNTAGLYLQSRSTGGGANVLVLTLTNITGSVITSMTINYTFNELVGTLGEELPGWHAYYSLSGAANSWTKIPAFSTATPGALSATFTLGSWPANTRMFIMWLDDNAANGAGFNEGGYTMDNFVITNVGATIFPVAIINGPAPTNLTVTASESATFTVGVSGTAPHFRWYRGTTPVGVDSPTLTIPSTVPGDAGAYTVVVSNSLNSVTSTVASLSVVVDTFPPTLVSAVGRPSRTHVLVTFSEPVTIGSAEEINYYSITNLAGDELTINSAVLVNPTTVDLTTSLQAPETAYVVVVSFVEDVSPQHNVILPGSTIGFTSSAPGGEIGGVLLREFYEGLGGNTIGDLINSTAFLGGNPTTTDFVTTFISPTHGDNYGARVSGYLLPTETSTYTFQMNRDDAGRIYLSTNSTQVGKVQILDGPCCGTLDSAPVVLLAGQSYYIEGLVKEGGGGDYLELRWKNTGSLPVFTNILATNLAYLYSLSITQQPADQIYSVNPGTTLLAQDFNSGDGGFTVTTPLAYDGPWVYNAGTGSWRENGQVPENNHANTSLLTSPPMVLTTAGGVTLSFDHRYSFEHDGTAWDGGQVLISVNGGAFTPVAAGSFTQNGYNGNAVSIGAPSFVNTSPGFAGGFITSQAYLGSFNNGDSIRVQFNAANDSNTGGSSAPPSWEIDALTVKQGVSGPVTFTVGSKAGYAAHLRHQWHRSDDGGATYSPLAGAVTADYLLFPVPADIGARFRCEVSLVGNFMTNLSASATLISGLPLHISAVSYDANNEQLTLKWDSAFGALYTVEGSQDLIGWDNVTTGIPSGGVTTTFVVDGPQPGTYYRIRKQ